MNQVRQIEVRGFKWPRRSTTICMAHFLGEDHFGRWLGVQRGDRWWNADRTEQGLFIEPLVKLVPSGTFWSVCFQPVDPVVDVDIILPVHWQDDLLEEVDLELDVQRFADGRVEVRDQEKFAQVRERYAMPDEIVMQAEATCEQMRQMVTYGFEPFGSVV